MKKIWLPGFFCFCGCFQMFDRKETFIRKYALTNGDSLELWSAGSGATDVDDIWAVKKRSNQKTKDTVCNLLGYNEHYKISFRQINDSVIRLTLSDSSRFRTTNDSSVNIINLNRTVITCAYPH